MKFLAAGFVSPRSGLVSIWGVNQCIKYLPSSLILSFKHINKKRKMLWAKKKLEKHREQPEEKIINRNNFRNDRMMELAE